MQSAGSCEDGLACHTWFPEGLSIPPIPAEVRFSRRGLRLSQGCSLVSFGRGRSRAGPWPRVRRTWRPLSRSQSIKDQVYPDSHGPLPESGRSGSARFQVGAGITCEAHTEMNFFIFCGSVESSKVSLKSRYCYDNHLLGC